MKRCAIYARVSTVGHGQTTDNQTRELHQAAAEKGWKIVSEFVDNGISGAKDRTQRPGFNALWEAVVAHKIDVVAVWSTDRLGRSLSHLVSFMDDLRKAGKVDLYIHTQGFDTTTPAGRAMFQMSGVFAEFEREMICTRVKAGLARAKEDGKTLGAPKTAKEPAIRKLLEAGFGFREIRRETGAGYSSIQRIKREMGI